MIDQIKAGGVKVYFIEDSNDARLVMQIADATGAKAGAGSTPKRCRPLTGLPTPVWI